MPASAVWFILVLAAIPVAWYAGQWATLVKDPCRRGCVIGAVFLLLLGWAMLVHHPALAVQLIPVSALAKLEGVAAAPLFIFVLGVGWRKAIHRRQQAIMILGMVLGLAYFVQGGLWMMRPTPTNAFSEHNNRYLVWQTQDYSCVPAASATALRMLGIRTSEREMAQLTETREGTGSTLLRALNGMENRLKHTGLEPKLIEPTYEDLMVIEPPMLTPLRYEAARLHMVTILEVRPTMVLVADPQNGIEFLSRYEFESYYRGQVIAFDGKAQRATAADVLAQNPHIRDPQSRVMQPIATTVDAR